MAATSTSMVATSQLSVPCTHKDHTYDVSGNKPTDTHTEVCQYCTTAFQPEQHQVVDGKCTVCGTTIEEPTGIMEKNVQSSMFNVQCNTWYTLEGVKLSRKPTAKGIYINNGKAVVIE